MPRTINSIGSVALLVSSITGPSLVVIPLLFQQAGWLTPILTFAAISLLSGAAALFVVEIMSSIEGNESFQASIEFTTIAHLFLGRKWHIVVQALLYLAMETLVVASLLESFQSMDAFLISVAHKTCAVSFSHGWTCVNQFPSNSASAFTGHILGSFGTLITLCLILPLSLVHLVDNIIFQVASFVVLILITIIWIVIFAIFGLQTNRVPVVGHTQSTVAGFVLSNFSFVTTIPAWVNNTHPSVNIRRAVWLSIIISCLIYIPVGWMGGLAFVLSNNATLLQVLASDTGHGALSTVARVSSYIFPLAVLITSIPVFTIVVRYNLLRGNICSNKMAIFWSAIFPWLVVIPFQTNNSLPTILNWSSLIFTSPSNLLVPFILFILSKRHMASAVLDASVSPEMPPASEIATPCTPVRPSAAQELTMTPAENIPVVIITDSTDREPDSTDGDKSLVSRVSQEVEKPATGGIPMQVMNRVSSPSKHRYYGQEVVNEATEPSVANVMDRPILFLETPDKAASETSDKRRRPSLSVSLSPSYSITHSSNTGMDEFLLINSPTSMRSRSHSMRSILGTRSSRPSVSTGTEPPVSMMDERHSRAGASSHTKSDSILQGEVRLTMSPTTAEDEQPAVFRAFPCIPQTSPVRPTRISAVSFVVAAALVVTAIVYSIVQAAGESGG